MKLINLVEKKSIISDCEITVVDRRLTWAVKLKDPHLQKKQTIQTKRNLHLNAEVNREKSKKNRRWKPRKGTGGKRTMCIWLSSYSEEGEG